ncbi:MAG: hypothetical protein KDK33_19355 [Leptospiraceae bacterium]|nr:hypothetical protein [Leptospiraceae bacterium]
MKECVKVKNLLPALILANLLLQAPIAAEDSGPGSDLFLNFLELYAANPASSSGENASSLVNSVRNNTSIYSSQIVKYNEISSQSSSPLSPGFKYSRRFEDSDWFIGVKYAESNEITFLRTIYGNDNSYYRDQAKTRERTTGITLGIGPLNYVTDDSSSEVAFSYTTTRSRGPYSQWFLKSPSFVTAALIAQNPSSSEAALDNYNLISFSTGQMNFDIETYTFRAGYAGSVTDWLNLYFTSDFDYVSGKLKLSTASAGTVSQALSASTTATLPNPNYISYVDGRITGFLLKLELGTVFKLYPGIGLRVGYYGQVPFLNLEVENSFDTFRSSSSDPYLQGYSDVEPTSLSDRHTFVHGSYIALVANF